jgi:enamine deaminase RidA (YjgF/YER057c/UK114 family)
VSERQRISSGLAFELIAGYSRAVRVGNQVWVSGTAPLNSDGSCPSTIEAQFRRCCEIIDMALGQCGGSLADVVRTRVYLVDPMDADAVARTHGEVFAEARPANTMVAVRSLLSPEWRVEVEVDAMLASLVREPQGS